MKSNVGIYSLLLAIAGFISLEASLHLGWVEGPFWRILTTGFEAGTIGGLADWFAVSALFYEIPIPYVRKHTNIIVKNREKLTEGIVELVATKWLSPEVLRERLANVQIATSLLKSLETKENVGKLLDFIRLVLLRFAGEMDHPRLPVIIQKFLKDRLHHVDIAGPLGRWLRETISEKRHQGLMSMALHQFSLSIQEPETRTLVLDKLKEALNAYAKKDWVKRSAVWLGKQTGGIDPDLLTDRILDLALVLVAETKDDPDHPLRQKMDQYLLEFATNLETGEARSLAYLHSLKQNWILNDKTRGIISELLGQWKDSIAVQLSGIHSPLMQFIQNQVIRFLEELREDEESRAKLDQWIRASVSQLVHQYHPELGNMVRSSLGKLDDKGIMLQIKDKVGNDLQYIRLNGAVVGGLVGLLIATLRWLLL
ncbi:Uncharacterized membrane-anchored protein YjiN, DUF445 family [Cyclobacterium lianum]|uniref:Uncharacterized membrane-anchored protein YjiN, DUF445 family n=1 Tax=Cyclobacterium lianum TaxID=388280 RepID=A0A1M7P0I5_9BACT|nr:DUF445 domain-containing protein [Cyclobacterium lianum]SHN09873.1 Uncharacterized membrane-anchored protein YjiN, DUF445 family [Cyclobacterium lianum]